MRRTLAILVAALVVAACAPSQTPGTAPTTSGQPTPPSRPLSMIVGREPTSLSLKALGQANSTTQSTRRLFNATLTIFDAAGTPLPYLAESLPELNAASWQVAPDGRMDTTYRLRPGLVWHDGAPLTAEDFVFSWRMYAQPQLGQASSLPFSSIEDVVAPDAQTILIHWKRPYPTAGVLEGEIPPTPRHVLGSALDQLESGAMSADAFIHQPYWTTEFIGAGPYRLERWESGVSLGGAAFDQHVLGRPLIDRVTVGFSLDQNASLARVLGGYVDYAADGALGNPQAISLKDEWASNRGGAILVKLDYFRGAYAQLRPEQASPAAILETPVRQALAFAVDRQALHDGLDGFQGGNIDAEGPFIPPTAAYYAQIDRAITKYPHDLRRSEQLMRDAGLSKGADGFYRGAAEGRLQWEIKTSGSVDNQTETAILASSWRQAGFDFQEAVLPGSLAQDGQARATFPTYYSFGTAVGESMLIGMNTNGIPRPENRWSGSNRGGWSNPGFDRLADTLTQTLDPDQRAQLIAQMTALVSRDAVAIPLYFYGNPLAATSAVVGVGPVAQEATFEWNIHQWKLAR
jgi:peptide/nickel transport system substrate-binding protein